MITPEEAEKLAHKTVEDYMYSCDCDTTEDAANALMKLASMCGLAMRATVGQDEAVKRLQGTTDYIAKPEHAESQNKNPVKTSGIIIDDWKLPIFKKTLDAEGYKYTEHSGKSPGLIVLNVETDNTAKLAPIVEKMNAEAARSRMN